MNGDPVPAFAEAVTRAASTAAHIGAGEGEDVEHDVGGRHRESQLLGSGLARVQAPLQRGRVDPSLGPDDELTVERNVAVELPDSGNDFREVPGERAVLLRLQNNRVQAPQSDAAEASSFGSAAQPLGWPVGNCSARTASIGRTGYVDGPWRRPVTGSLRTDYASATPVNNGRK